MSVIEEALTEQFYAWERRGRGWEVFPGPVSPEPPFRPFYGHHFSPDAIIDDGRRQTLLSSLVKRLSSRLGGAESFPAAPTIEDEEEPEPEYLIRAPLVELQAFFPAGFSVTREEFAQFLLCLSLCREPVTFELLGIADRVIAQFAAHPGDEMFLRQQLEACFPEVTFLVANGALEAAWLASPPKSEALIVEFGLAKEFMLALSPGKRDPFVNIIGVLSDLQPEEAGLFQVIFKPVSDNAGGAFFVNAPELFRKAQEKIARPLYAAVVRMAFKSPSEGQSWQYARRLASVLGMFNQPGSNELIPLANDHYPSDLHEEDMLRRQSRRPGMIVNSDELLGFVHLPSAEVRSPKVVRQTRRSKSAPNIVQNAQGLRLGENVHAGKNTAVLLSPDQRTRHIHVIGASGTGKSTLLFNLIRQDIEQCRGVALLDPHGDLTDRLLGVIPPNRVEDVVLFDPTDEEHSIGFNILSAHNDFERNLLASDLVSVFQRLSTSWGDQMGSVLQNAIMAFLESDRGGTLADLRRFLIEPDFREKFLATVRDPGIVYYWKKGFTQLSGNKSIGPVITRLDSFLSPKTLRYVVSQSRNRLDFADIMDTGKIFLAKLSQGLLGRENSFLLGSLIVSKLQQVVMARQRQGEAFRRDYAVFIDEFNNFICPSMAEILSSARKYRLGLALAHHELRQLQRDPDVGSAVLSNSGTRICFRVSDEDARKLAEGFGFFEAADLQQLATGEAICRVERSDFDFNLNVPNPIYAPEDEARKRREQVIVASRKKYSTPRAEVEAELYRDLPLAEARLPETREVTGSGLPIAQNPKSEPPPVAPYVPVPTPPKVPAIVERKAEAPPEQRSLGRGGKQHIYLQNLIKQLAIGFHFEAD